MKPKVENLENLILNLCKEGEEIILPEIVWAGGDQIKSITVKEGRACFVAIEDEEGTEDTLSLRCGWPKDSRRRVLEMLLVLSGEENSDMTEEEYAEVERGLNKSETLEALKETMGALKDIINAAGNGQPYNAMELEKLFNPVLNKANETIYTVTGEYI